MRPSNSIKAQMAHKAAKAPKEPRICRECGQPFELPSLRSGEVCYRCAVRFDRQTGGTS